MKQTTTDNMKPLTEHFKARTKLPVSSSSHKHKELTKSVTHVLAKDMVPPYSVAKKRV